MLDFVSYYSQVYAQPVNEDIVKKLRIEDNMAMYIEEACKELARALPAHIEYCGYSYDDNPKRIREMSQGKDFVVKKDSDDGIPSVNINYSYSRQAVFKFKTKYDKEIRTIRMPIYIPLLIDDYHYYIRGNKYAAPLQLVDAITYTGKGDSVVLKTMTRAIKISREKLIITDVHGQQYQTAGFYIHVNVKKVPMLLYYFAFYGFSKTMIYFGCEKFIKFYDQPPIEPDPSMIFFKFGKLYCAVDRERFNSNYLLRQYVATMLLVSKKGLDREMICSTDYWKIILGATAMNETNARDKGISLLNTFYTSLDYRTSKNIDMIVGGPKRTTTFAVVRWVFIKYNTLSIKNSSLVNKKLRLGEYLVTPLVRDIYNRLYRFLNTARHMRDQKKLLDIFKISPAIILNAIIGKAKNKRMALNIAKYSSYVNDLTLLNVALKYTSAGPGSPIEKSGKLAGPYFRQFNPTYTGHICLITTSNGDPGVSGTLTPFAKIKSDSMTFDLEG